MKEAEGRTLGDGVVALIGDKKALLLLDNLEQVVAAASEVAGLVESCPGLRIVTTSRTPLRIAAEREYPLAPLALPPSSDPDSTESLDGVSGHRAVRRARQTTRGSFELTPENAGAVAAVCRRLDGLPLALELAAARLRLLSPEALLERLDHALDVLTSGPSRHSRAAADAARHDRLEPLAPRRSRSSACSGAWPSSPEGAPSPTSRPSAQTPARPSSTSWSRSSTRLSCRRTARVTGSGCCRRSASTRASGSRPRARRARSR